MDDHRLEKIRRLVRRGQWIPSSHVRKDYIETGVCGVEDIEQSILTGAVTKEEKDEFHMAVDGMKYTIQGRSYCGLGFETVGKIIDGGDGLQYFVITAYNYRRG